MIKNPSCNDLGFFKSRFYRVLTIFNNFNIIRYIRGKDKCEENINIIDDCKYWFICK